MTDQDYSASDAAYDYDDGPCAACGGTDLPLRSCPRCERDVCAGCTLRDEGQGGSTVRLVPSTAPYSVDACRACAEEYVREARSYLAGPSGTLELFTEEGEG